jgi:hypothetical protein
MSDAFIIWKTENGWCVTPWPAPSIMGAYQRAVSSFSSFGEAIEWLEQQGKPPRRSWEDINGVETKPNVRCVPRHG